VPITPKQFHLARRRSDLSASDFQRAWERHGRTIMAYPFWANVRRYTQQHAVALRPDTAARIPGHTDAFDGLSAIWFHDPIALASLFADETHPEALRDEDRVFHSRSPNASLFTEPTHERSDREAPVKLVRFIERPPAMPAREFIEHWHEHSERLLADAHVTRHTADYAASLSLSVLAEDAAGCADPLDDARPRSLLDGFEGVIELGFGSFVELSAALDESAFQLAVHDDLDRFGEPETHLAVVTCERLRYED
jgi:hypothetical protein